MIPSGPDEPFERRLGQLLHDLETGPGDEIRALAADGLARIGLPAVPALLERLERSPTRWVARALQGIGPRALPAVLDLMERNPRPPDPLRVQVLASTHSRGALPTLLGALRDPAPGVREIAVASLGDLGVVEAAPALLEALRDGDAAVRAEAAGALGRLRWASAEEALILAAADRDADVRERAAAALGEFGSGRALKRVVTALADDSLAVRLEAVRMVGEHHRLDAVPSLAERLRHPAAVVDLELDAVLDALLLLAPPEVEADLVAFLRGPRASQRSDARQPSHGDLVAGVLEVLGTKAAREAKAAWRSARGTA